MAHILIVDDEPYQRLLIRETLANDPSFTFAEAEDGVQALELARQLPHPDLLILDVMMPQLDGFQVCRTLKADPELRAAQVILVTALGQLQDKVNGLDAGADDFVNKPFEESELQARVRSALRIKAMHDQLEQLLHLRDSLVRMIMHDMGNLVTAITASLSLHERMEPGTPDAVQLTRDAFEASLNLRDMISDALDVSTSESRSLPINRKDTDLVALIGGLLEYFRGSAMGGNIQLEFKVEDGFDPLVNIDSELIRRVVVNLLTNAFKYAPPDTHIWVNIGSNDAHSFCISVTDEGPGIPLEEQTLIFNKYELAQLYRNHQERPGRGLGLTFSKMAVEGHNGTIKVSSKPGEGATFTIEVPRL